jgi:stage V sporulation protein R
VSLSAELRALQREIESLVGDYGLTTFPVVFETVDYAQMNRLAAYTGFPLRYPHWRWGMEFQRLSRSYEYGLHKVYEMVINNDPTYAYLLDGNTNLDQKLVMAHVYGHADFFRNNVYFSHTNRKMVDQMANHATRVRRHRDRFGVDRVERFLDACLALENLIDPNAAFTWHYGLDEAQAREEREPECARPMPAKDYMQRYVNPPDFLERQQERLDREAAARRHLPGTPQRDVLGFLLREAPLENWERDLLAIVREEAYYFLPQRQTKIMNEGWATYWHTRLLTGHLLRQDEVIDYADHHSGTTASQPAQLNPYKLGLELFRDIARRWDTGRFGQQWRECDDLARRADWDSGLGLGLQKIMEVRRVHNDLSFLDEFLTEEFCRDQKLFVYSRHRRKNAWVVSSREFARIKQSLLFKLTNAGAPPIEIVDANHGNRNELLLLHRHDGVDLRQQWAKQTLVHLQRIWGRPVMLDTVVRARPCRLGYTGEKHVEESLSQPAGAGVPA